jgi:hypothetical protein
MDRVESFRNGRQAWRLLCSFAGNVGHRWGLLIAGAMFSFLGFYLPFLGVSAVPRWFVFCVVTPLTVFIASFLAWREERLRYLDLRDLTSQQIADLKAQLASALEGAAINAEAAAAKTSRKNAVILLQGLDLEGEQIMRRWHHEFDIEMHEDELTGWVSTVDAVLANSFPAERLEFASQIAVPPVPLDMESEAMRIIPQRRNGVLWIWPRLFQLREIMKTLKGKAP